MGLKTVSAAFALSLLASVAQAGFLGPNYPVQANDTGGIIAWSPAIAYVYRDIAAASCARWNKVATITSVHPWYGDYVAFRCVFPRGYDPVKALAPWRWPFWFGR